MNVSPTGRITAAAVMALMAAATVVSVTDDGPATARVTAASGSSAATVPDPVPSIEVEPLDPAETDEPDDPKHDEPTGQSTQPAPAPTTSKPTTPAPSTTPSRPSPSPTSPSPSQTPTQPNLVEVLVDLLS